MLKNAFKKSFLVRRVVSTGFSWCDFFALLASAYCTASLTPVIAGDFTSLQYTAYISRPAFWGVFAISLAAFFTLLLLTKTTRSISWCLYVSSAALAVSLVSNLAGEIFFNIGIAFVLLVVVKYVTGSDRLGLSKIKITSRLSFFITAGMFLLFWIFISVCTVARYRGFYDGTFDFGIFCQMFEQMAKTGIPYTTVERGELMSHFAVHFSPVFYLMLPGYLIFRSPVYLLCAQAFVVGFGMFPLRRICLSLGMSPALSAVAAMMYGFYPTMANGCFYDFHENKLLSVLLLYMIYFVLEKKRAGIAAFALLTLSVKEDAMIYVIAVALWMLFTGRDRLFAVIIAAFAAAYFFFACEMIQLSGGEIMSGRFDNYNPDGDGSLFSAVKTCLYDIGYLIREVFCGADVDSFNEVTYTGQKLEFVLWTCVPLLFTPFTSKHSAHLVLLIPMLVINLMPSWLYQYDISFQYTYGTCALLFASAALTVSEYSPEKRRFFAVAGVSLCLVFSASSTLPKITGNLSRYYMSKVDYDETEKTLESVPKDTSVTAYGYIVPHLYYIDDLNSCPDYYKDLQQTEYYVVDTRYAHDSHTKKMYEAMKDDYSLVAEGGYAEVYRLKSSIESD